MGEESEKLLSASAATEETILEKPITGEEVTPILAKQRDEEEEQVKQAVETTVVAEEATERDAPPEEPPVDPLKEESYFVKDLKESEKKALQELKAKIELAIKNNNMLTPRKLAEQRSSNRGVDVQEEKKPDKEKKEEEATATEEAKDAAAVEEAKEVPIVEEANPAPPPAVEVHVEGLPKDTHRPPAEATTREVNAAAKEVTTEVFEVAGTSASLTEKHPPSIEGGGVPAGADDSPSLEDLALWGVPLLPSKGDERTDAILLKFLRARDFKVNDAVSMLRDTMLWRKSFNAEGLIDEEITNEFDSVAYMHGFDKDGHPVCYNHFGVFQDKELYQKTFEDEAQFQKFLRWRVQMMEKGIKMLDFNTNGVHSIVQITDFKDSPGLFKVRNLTKKALNLLQDNYPELVAKQIFLNVPWYFGALYSVIGAIVTPRSKSKVVIARPGKVTEALYTYISPENVPVQYGGFSRPNDSEFEGVGASAMEVFVKAGEKQTIEIAVEEPGSTLVWDIIVVGWEVGYGEEFVPTAEGSYTVVIQKPKKVASDEKLLRNSFKATEAGKVVLTIDATASKRKKHVLYRHITKKGSE